MEQHRAFSKPLGIASRSSAAGSQSRTSRCRLSSGVEQGMTHPCVARPRAMGRRRRCRRGSKAQPCSRDSTVPGSGDELPRYRSGYRRAIGDWPNLAIRVTLCCHDKCEHFESLPSARWHSRQSIRKPRWSRRGASPSWGLKICRTTRVSHLSGRSSGLAASRFFSSLQRREAGFGPVRSAKGRHGSTSDIFWSLSISSFSYIEPCGLHTTLHTPGRLSSPDVS
jgi:hypothetical protein